MRESWSERLARATRLAGGGHAAASLLASYADVLALQERAYESLKSQLARAASGSLARDLPFVRTQVLPLLETIVQRGPEPLALEAARLFETAGEGAIDDMLLTYWRAPSDGAFFAKAALQPYASWLAEARIAPTDRPLTRTGNRCPFCGGSPQLSILHTSSDLEGGGRLLQCATCLTTWPFRRVVCAYCGEEDDRRLAYFHSPDFEHLRVDACDSCQHYVKTVDLTRLGLAVPLVDEVAGASLDLWARERGYEKIELNLMGL